MPGPSQATYLRRRAVAGLIALGVVVGLFLVLRGGGDGEPASAPVRAAAAPGRPAVPARKAPATDLASIAARANVPVLCYHQIRPLTGADSANDRVYIVPPKVLDDQLGALKRAGYHSVSAKAVADHMAKGTRLPFKPILLTFDDASAGQYTRALPIVRKHGFTATFFVMTVVLGKEGWLTRGQVRKLDRDGMEIGAHTWDHQAVPDYTDEQWRVQLTQPKAELEKLVGHPIDVFAYPFGLWNSAAFSRLRDGGVRVAFQLADAIDRADPMLTARRVIVGPDVGGRALLKMVRQDF